MNNNWKNIRKMIEYPRSGILSKEIIKNDKIDVSLFCMAKETALSEHTSTREGMVFVLEGEGIFNLESKDIEMTAGIMIHMKKNAAHSLKAEKNTAFVLILFNNQ